MVRVGRRMIVRFFVARCANYSLMRRVSRYALRRKTVSDAVEKAKRYRPDIIVTDLFMPLMNGFEETRILRKLMTECP